MRSVRVCNEMDESAVETEVEDVSPSNKGREDEVLRKRSRTVAEGEALFAVLLLLSPVVLAEHEVREGEAATSISAGCDASGGLVSAITAA